MSSPGRELRNRDSSPGPRRWSRLVAVTVLAGLGLLLAVRLGPSLLGLRTFTGVDLLAALPPWSGGNPVPAPGNPWVGDQIDHFLPGYLQMHERLLAGDVPWWSTINGAGLPLLGAANLPALTPTSVWMLLLPTWWAPGFVKLVQVVLVMAGMTAWLRSLGLSVAAGLVAGLAYCGSGFFVAWSAWPPQSGVAATIPALFWAIERFLARGSARAALPMALVVAWLLLGGFPAVAVHALYAGAAYFIVRCWVVRSGDRRDALRVGLIGVGAVLLGILASAVQMLPMITALVATNRDYRADQFFLTEPFRSALSVFFPTTFGQGPDAYPGSNPVEAYAFVGMATVALAGLAVLAHRAPGMPRGVLPVLVVTTVLAAALVWFQGPWTSWMAHLPGLSGNRSGRLRDLFSFGMCAMAGIGFHLVLVGPAGTAQRRWAAVAAWTMALLGSVLTMGVVLRYRGAVDAGSLGRDALLAVVGVVAVAVACSLRHTRPRGSATPVVLVGVAVVLVTQVAASTGGFWTDSARADFYPSTPALAAAQDRTGAGRAVLGSVLLGSSAGAYGLRTVTAHAFAPDPWQELLRRIDPAAYSGAGRSPTNPGLDLSLTDGSLTDPLYDRLSTTTVLADPAYELPGPVAALPVAAPDGGVEVRPGSPTPAVPLPAQALRGFRLSLVQDVPPQAAGVSLVATIRDGAGDVVARGETRRSVWTAGAVQIPVAGEQLAAATGTLTVQFSVESGGESAPAMELGVTGGQFTGGVVQSQDDGLVEVYADASMTVWQRPSALPRVRWAAESAVVTDGTERLDRLADPATPRAEVLLSEPGPAASGAPGEVVLEQDTGDRIVASVSVGGDGYLVVADALQQGWVVEVDGVEANLVAADHAFGAVFVPAGDHRVTFRFVGDGLRAGAALTATAVLVTVGVLLQPAALRRWRRSRRGGARPLDEP